MSFDEQLRNERILFLNQLAENPEIDVYDLGDRLALPKEKTMTFLRSFFKILAQYTNQDDKLDRTSYNDVKTIMNEGVSVEFGGLNDRALDNLIHVYEKYRNIEPDLYIEADGIRSTRTFRPKVAQRVAHNASSRIPGLDNEPSHPEFQPQPGGVQIPEKGGDFNVDRLNKGFSYDFLTSLKRIGLVRWALEGLPYPPAQSKIESYAQYFEINQDEIFMSPDALRTSMMKWFGDKTGDHAAQIIYSYVKFLPQSEGFGVQKIGGQLREGYFAGNDPMFQSPNQGGAIPFNNNTTRNSFSSFGFSSQGQGQGPRFADPYNTFYHAEFVLPYGMNAYSDDAKRLIHEYERKRREKQEQKERMDEMMDSARNRMSMAWAEMFEQKKGGPMATAGGGGSMFGPEFMQSMIMMSMLAAVSSGKMVASPYTDENGRIQVKLEQQQGSTDGIAGQDPNVPTFRDTLELVKTMYETIDKKREDATNFKLEWIKDQMNKEGQTSPIQQIGETMKAIKEVFPQFSMGGNGHGGPDSLEIAKLGLEREKFSYDKERTDTLIDHKFEIEKERERMEHEDAIQANKTRNITIKAISNAISHNLPMFLNLVTMFLSMRNPQLAPIAAGLAGGSNSRGGGGLGGITDLIGNVLKGISGGATDEDDDEDEDEKPKKKSKQANNPFASMFGGGGGNEEEEEEEDQEGNFDISQIMGGVTDLLKNIGVPTAAAPQQQQPQQQAQHAHHRHVHQRVNRTGGFRPTFRDVEVGNTNASVIMPPPGAEATNAYEDVEMTTAKRISTSPTISEAPAQMELQPFTNVYEETQQQGVIIPEPSGQVVEQVTTVKEEPYYPGTETAEDEYYEGEEGEGEYQEYRPEDFEGKSPEELLELKKRGLESMSSTESYLSSIDEQLKKAKKKGRA